MADFPFPGLNLAVATPFADNGEIDFNTLERNLERYIAIGVKGFVLSSGTGIHVYLKEDESKAVIERGTKIIKGRAKVIAQSSALLTEDVVRRTRFAKDVGADGVMVLPPFFEGPTEDDEIVDFYSRVAGVGLPVIGYNVPEAVGFAVSPSLLGKLSAIPNFCSVKDSGGDMSKHAELIATGHNVMNGADQLVPYAMYAGCSGLIWGGANFAPKTCLAIAEAGVKKDWNKVREIWTALEPIMSLITQGDYVKSVYAAAEMMGYSAGVPRKPLSGLSADRLPAIRKALEGLKALEA
jgi:4-hydroxy-tetrahydrodipicolinate synthase